MAFVLVRTADGHTIEATTADPATEVAHRLGRVIERERSQVRGVVRIDRAHDGSVVLVPLAAVTAVEVAEGEVEKPDTLAVVPA